MALQDTPGLDYSIPERLTPSMVGLGWGETPRGDKSQP